MITLLGLRELWELRREGKKLPEGWSEQAKEYLEVKEKMVQEFGREWDKAQLQEAKAIIRGLYAYA